MKSYRFFWRDGSVTEQCGQDLSDAFVRHRAAAGENLLQWEETDSPSAPEALEGIATFERRLLR